MAWILRRGLVLLRKSREVGRLYFVQLLLNRLIPTFVFSLNKLLLVSTDIRSFKEDRVSDPEFRWAGPRDIEKVTATGAPAAMVRQNFTAGARLAVIERGGRIVAYFWCQVDSADHYDWLRYKLMPNDVWIVYAWVAPGLRGQGLHARISNLVFAEFARDGYLRCLSVVDALNRNVIRAGAKGNARLIGYVGFIRIFGLTLVLFDRSARVGWWGLGRRFDLPIGRIGGDRAV